MARDLLQRWHEPDDRDDERRLGLEPAQDFLVAQRAAAEAPSKSFSSTTNMSETSLSGGVSWGGDVQRWHTGCLVKYCTSEGCRNERCKFLHDLSPEEVALFTAKNKDDHLLFRGENNSLSSDRHSSESTSSDRGFSMWHSDRNRIDWSKQERAGSQENDTDRIVDLGMLPSRGSDKHASGKCKPCMFARLEDCAEGANCRFCHLPHVNPKIKIRQCKGKRERFKKLASRLSQRIDEDPDCFDPEHVEMPPSVARNLVLRTKLISLMTERAERVRADRAASRVEAPANDFEAAVAEVVSQGIPQKVSL